MVIGKLFDKYWQWKGVRTISVSSSSAHFDTSKQIYTGSTARSVRYLINNEQILLSNLVQELQSDDVFYDIGAHIGGFSCIASHIIEEGQIELFEPDTRDFGVLRSNIKLNNADQITHHPILLSDERGKQQFQGGSMSNEKGDIVNVWRLDDYIDEHTLPSPSVMKMDIEGAELRALNGATDALDSIRVLYLEAHTGDYERSMRQFGDSESELYDFILDLGFNIDILNNRNNEIHLKASKTSS